jgi:bacterioferritin
MFEQGALPENHFLSDIMALQRDPWVLPTPTSQEISREKSIQLLQTVLSAEIVCVLRYTAISVSPDALRSDWIAAEFQEQANDERQHMARVAARIEQFGGIPDFRTPMAAVRRYGAGDYSLAKRVRENLAAERSIIEYYNDLIQYFAGFDPETAELLREIVVDEENHTSDLEDLIGSCS